jgi:hypothetical protein
MPAAVLLKASKNKFIDISHVTKTTTNITPVGEP